MTGICENGENDGDADVDEGHEEQRNDVEDDEVEYCVDARVDRQRVDTERRVRARRNDRLAPCTAAQLSGAHRPHETPSPSFGLIEQALTSHQTHYMSHWGRVFTGQMTQPTVSKH